jgi:Family of unknown function (DUF5519)
MAGLDSFVGTFMSRNMSARERIAEAVLAWPGVEQASHRFGGIEFRLGRRELGHLHGDALVDLPFPRKVRDDLVAQGRARPHHVLPDSGWVSFWIESPDDVERAIWLLRLAYERALAARARAEAA